MMAGGAETERGEWRERHVAPPAAGGGGGDQVEKLVGAAYLADLLLERPAPGTDGAVVVSVQFQRRHEGHLYDDVVVDAVASEEPRVLEVQVKRTVRFTSSDSALLDLLAEGLRSLRRHGEAYRRPRRLRRLAVAVRASDSRAVQEMVDLTEHARAVSTPEEFYELIVTPGVTRQELRDRLDRLVAAKAKVDDQRPRDRDPELWQWLDALVVVRFDLDGAAARDRPALLGALAGLYEPPDASRAQHLFDALRVAVADLAPWAGSVDRDRLLAALPRALAPGTTAPQPSRVDRVAQADALLRGPLLALRLMPELNRAERLRETAPRDAASSFQVVADGLEAGGYPGHAVLLRRRQAAALRLAGDADAAGAVLVPLAWKYLDRGEADEAFTLVRELEDLVQDATATEALRRRAAGLSAVHDLLSDPTDQLEALASAVDALLDGADALAADFARFLAEYALVTEQPAFILERVSRLQETASNVASTDPETSARLLFCLADATDDWTSLLTDARRRMEPQLLALMFARYARYSAWSGHPDRAGQAWWDAVERGCHAGLEEDAAQWLYAQGELDRRYGPLPTDPNEPRHLAQAVLLTGNGRFLPRGRARERALERLQASRLPAAADALRRYHAESVVVGHWSSELDAHVLLGDLFTRTGDLAEAAHHYVRGGATKQLEQMLAGPEQCYVGLGAELDRASPWERATVYTAMAAQGDLVPDHQVEPLLTRALTEAGEYLAGRIRQSPFVPSVGLAAFKVIGQLADQCPADQVDAVLNLLAPLTAREPNTYRHSDDGHMRALVGLLRTHPGRAPEIVSQLLDALAADQSMGELLLREGDDLVEAHRELFLPRLANLANEGNQRAASALALLGEHNDEQRARARDALTRILQPREREPGTASGIVLIPDSLLALSLDPPERERYAARLVEMVEDHEDLSVNRKEGLAALRNLAKELSDRTRDRLFSLGIACARREQDGGSVLDEALARTLHPLSRFRIDLGGSLAPSGLRLAAAAAHTDHQYQQTRDLALALVPGGDERMIDQVAWTLAALPRSFLTRDLRLLAASPHSPLRALAALGWSDDPAAVPELGASLARDRDAVVRRTLADALTAVADRDHEMAAQVASVLAQDARYSVRRRVQQLDLPDGN